MIQLLPPGVAAKGTLIAPKSLLGRAYLHPHVARDDVLEKPIKPFLHTGTTPIIRRADRFQAVQKRKTHDSNDQASSSTNTPRVHDDTVFAQQPKLRARAAFRVVKHHKSGNK